MNPTYTTASVGQTVQLGASPRDATNNPMNTSVSWFTSDPAVATVSSSGAVTVKDVGVAVISAVSQGVTGNAAVAIGVPANTHPVGHVIIVLEENTEYSNVIGSTQAPFLNALATQYGLATAFYGNTHPSLPNYLAMTVGNTAGATSDSYTQTVTADNVVRELVAAGKTWKSYAEGLPTVGYLGGDVGSYVKHHNPFVYFGDVANDSVQRRGLVPFTQFAADLSAGTLPNYAFVVPNTCSDGHNCSLGVVDTWLRQNIGPLLRNPQFLNDGELIITFDEGSSSTNGGGHVVLTVIGPRAKRGFTSGTTYNHTNLARFSLEILGLTTFPNEAATATSMMEFLQ